MDLITILLIAVGLAMDAFAVSVASGCAIYSIRPRQALKIAAFFGGFQALMPVVGWLAGVTLRAYIVDYDHWIAFGLLVFLGAKMIYEATFIDTVDKCGDALNIMVLMGLSVATSIDALAVGVTFAVLNVTIVTPVLVIGAVTFAISYLGVLLGKKCYLWFPGKWIEITGGIILIAIGSKILYDHLSQGI